jgi:hypothetical protein
MVRTFPDPVDGEMSVAIDGLKGWSTSGWQGTLIYSGKAGLVFEPDIAISEDGTTAYLAMTSWAANEQVWAWALNLTNGNVKMAGTGSQANLPPRIAFDSDLEDALLLDVAAVKVAPTNPPPLASYNTPIWKIFRIHYDAATNTLSTPTDLSSHNVRQSGFEGDPAVRLPFSDYDFDCQRVATATDNCVVVAILTPENDDANHHPFGSLRSLAFNVDAQTSDVTFLTGGTGWQETIDSVNHLPTPLSTGLNGVIGVTISSNHLYVITGRTLQSGTDTNNTRVSEFTSTVSVASGVPTEDSVVNLKDDVETQTLTCNSHTTIDNETTSAASQHGGYSAAWCPSCGTSGGRLEGLAMLAPTDGFCF